MQNLGNQISETSLIERMLISHFYEETNPEGTRASEQDSVKFDKCQQGRVLVHKGRNNHLNPESKGNYHALTGFSN